MKVLVQWVTAEAPYNLGRSAVHEVGHWLGLYHLWGENGANECEGDDLVYDTPNQATSNEDCPTFPHQSCDNESDIFMNYMDYVEDACMFTEGQKERMQSTIFVSRSNLNPSLNLSENIINEVPESGGNYSFELQNPNPYYTINWSISTSESWITNISPISGANGTTVTFSISPNGTGLERAGIITIQTDDIYQTQLYVFVFQESGQTPIILRLTQAQDQTGDDFGSVGLYRMGEWKTGSAPKYYSVDDGQPLTMKFSYRFVPNTHSKFYVVRHYSNIIGYENIAYEYPSYNDYKGGFISAWDATLQNNYPELSGFSVSTNGTQIGFKDPWYTDLITNIGEKNRGLQAIYHYKSLPFEIKYSDNDYKGVFLNQNLNFLPNVPNYSVKATSPQTICVNGTNRNSYFLNWEADPVGSATFQNSNNLETSVVFNSDGAVVAANLKVSLMSNKSTAYTSNQRKFVRTSNGWLHNVYESMGQIWYEFKAPGGDWQIMSETANKHYLGEGGKSPAIDFCGGTTSLYNDMTLIVYQEGSNIQIESYFFTNANNYGNGPKATIYTGESPTSNLVPNVCWGSNNRLIVLWQTSSGIKYQIRPLDSYIYGPVASGIIPGTNSSCKDVAVSTDKSWNYSDAFFDIAWEQSNPSPTPNSIMYCCLVYGASVSFDPPEPLNVSTSSSKRDNNISIISTQYGPNISWIQDLTGYSDPWYMKTVLCEVDYITLSKYYHIYDHHCKSASLNRIEKNNYTDPEHYYLAWSQIYNETGWTDYNKFVSNSDFSQIEYLDTKGWDLQLNSGSSSSNMYVSSYYRSSSPYFSNLSNSLGSLSKTSSMAINHGRGCSFIIDGAGFYYAIGDIIVDNKKIGFVEVNDSTTYNTLKNVNKVLVTQPFTLNKNSLISFSENISINDSVIVKELLNTKGNINYRVEIIDYLTGKVIGKIIKSNFKSKRLKQNELTLYNIDTKGLESSSATIKVTINTNLKETEASIVDEYSDDTILNKASVQKINLDITGAITDYALTQNYPNPFNPSTQISYQIPNDGFVTLKIYDITGSEIKTLSRPEIS